MLFSFRFIYFLCLIEYFEQIIVILCRYCLSVNIVFFISTVLIRQALSIRYLTKTMLNPNGSMLNMTYHYTLLAYKKRKSKALNHSLYLIYFHGCHNSWKSGKPGKIRSFFFWLVKTWKFFNFKSPFWDWPHRACGYKQLAENFTNRLISGFSLWNGVKSRGNLRQIRPGKPGKVLFQMVLII